MTKAKCWIEAMRLRTLPVSVSAVLAGVGMGLLGGEFRAAPAVICLLFALLAQIASNFANEYYDFRSGIDAPGREGPRRGVTEGDIAPEDMRRATFATLAFACLLGCSLIYWGGWWLLPAGAVIALGALAYSAGPYPLSRHGWGQLMVIVFFGLVPVSLTCYLQTGEFTPGVFWMGLAVGFMAANILMVNNYRDRHDDRAVGKITEVTRWGRLYALWGYGIQAAAAAIITIPLWGRCGWWTLIFPGVYLCMAALLLFRISRLEGHRLNPLLGMTAMSELWFTATFLLSAALCFSTH